MPFLALSVGFGPDASPPFGALTIWPSSASQAQSTRVCGSVSRACQSCSNTPARPHSRKRRYADDSMARATSWQAEWDNRPIETLIPQETSTDPGRVIGWAEAKSRWLVDHNHRSEPETGPRQCCVCLAS